GGLFYGPVVAKVPVAFNHARLPWAASPWPAVSFRGPSPRNPHVRGSPLAASACFEGRRWPPSACFRRFCLAARRGPRCLSGGRAPGTTTYDGRRWPHPPASRVAVGRIRLLPVLLPTATVRSRYPFQGPGGRRCPACPTGAGVSRGR